MSIATRFPLLCAAVLVLPATTASADPGGAVFIEFNAGLLAVRLENAALSEVLRTVGEQAGVRVSIQGNLGNVQPQVFWGIPLPEGITLLVQNSNADLVMIYNRDNAGHRYLQRFERTKETAITVHLLTVHLFMRLPIFLRQHPLRYQCNRLAIKACRNMRRSSVGSLANAFEDYACEPIGFAHNHDHVWVLRYLFLFA